MPAAGPRPASGRLRLLILGGLRGMRRIGVVAALCPHDELTQSWRPGFDADEAVTSEAHRLGGIVSDGVLLANIARHVAGDGVYILERVGEVGDATGFIGQGFQSISRLPGFLPVVVVEQSDGIDHGPAPDSARGEWPPPGSGGKHCPLRR